MKKYILIFILLISIVLVTGCTKSSNRIEIFLVRDTLLDKCLNSKLEKLKADKTPIITQKDIKEYDWDRHIIVLKKDGSLKNRLEKELKGKVPTTGLPFILACNGERIYIGSFWTLASSVCAPKCPVIVVDNVLYSEVYELKIEYVFKNGDVRSSKKLYDTLKNLKLLKE